MFAPIVLQLRKRLGDAHFNRLRRTLITVHIQVISQVTNGLCIRNKCRQRLIRVANANGKKLGLLV